VERVLPLAADRSEIAAFCRRAGIRELSFFGSVLRADYTETSDIDVLVEFESPKSLLDHVRIQRELGDLLGRKVDLVTKRGLSGRIRDHILATRVVEYVKT
jgi:predicted nucleotidyltransferase